MMNRPVHCTESIGVACAAVVAFGALAVAQSVWAEDAERLAVDVRDCVHLESPEERFACYESRVGAALEEQRGAVVAEGDHAEERAAEPAPAAAVPADEAALPAETPAEAMSDAATPETGVTAPSTASAQSSTDNFGFRQPRERDVAEPEELHGTVAAIRETVPNSYLITLENGQVWRQMRPQRYPLREGHEVRIYPTNWGSAYRLSVAELGGFIQVERVR